MSSSQLQLYIFLKEKKLINPENEIPEYEDLLEEEKGRGEFETWKAELPEKELKDFNYVFGKE